jgi:hypothetical protein
MAARRSEGTARRLVLRRTEAIVRCAIEQQDKFQLISRMLCLFVLKIVGKLRSRSGGPFLDQIVDGSVQMTKRGNGREVIGRKEEEKE